MASIKIGSLVIRTLAKPISGILKNRAKEHPKFKELTIGLAQFLHRTDIRMRVNLAGESAKNIRPLNDAKAVDQGANFISEAFLFSVAVSLILAETLRGRKNASNRRDTVDDKLEALETQISELKAQLELSQTSNREYTTSTENMSKLVETLIDVGLRGGWMNRALDSDEDFKKRRKQLLENVVRIPIDEEEAKSRNGMLENGGSASIEGEKGVEQAVDPNVKS